VRPDYSPFPHGIAELWFILLARRQLARLEWPQQVAHSKLVLGAPLDDTLEPESVLREAKVTRANLIHSIEARRTFVTRSSVWKWETGNGKWEIGNWKLFHTHTGWLAGSNWPLAAKNAQ